MESFCHIGAWYGLHAVHDTPIHIDFYFVQFLCVLRYLFLAFFLIVLSNFLFPGLLPRFYRIGGRTQGPQFLFCNLLLFFLWSVMLVFSYMSPITNFLLPRCFYAHFPFSFLSLFSFLLLNQTRFSLHRLKFAG